MEGFWTLFQAVFLFGLVLGLAWLSTRMIGMRMGLAARGRMIRVLENVPVGRERSVMLLEVGGRVYLVGSTSDQISLIDAIEDPAVIERLMAQSPPEQPATFATMLPGGFREVLDKVKTYAALKPPQAPGAQAEESTEDRLKQQLERLRRLQDQEK